jgi:hydroxymethylbilane synthase
MKVGTRGSDLARAQTGIIAEMIRERLGIDIEIELIKTKGDIVTDRPLREIEGRGYFTKELEDALLDRRIDLAVHSFKDMPSQNPEGLVVACVSEREDPADLLIVRKDSFRSDKGEIPLSGSAVVGTSAVRRESQIKAKRGDLTLKDLRGNVPTRLQKLSNGQYDAIFLASAGVKRLKLDLGEFQVIRLQPEDFVPSPGQGALALQMRINDPKIGEIKNIIDDPETFIATSMERKVMGMFGGGCGLPLGAYSYRDGDIWRMYGFWGGDEGKPIWANASGRDPSSLAEKLYSELTHD